MGRRTNGTGRHSNHVRHAEGLSHKAHRTNHIKRDMRAVNREKLKAQLAQKRHPGTSTTLPESTRAKISATLRTWQRGGN